MTLWHTLGSLVLLWGTLTDSVDVRRPARVERPAATWTDWLTDSRNAVFAVLLAALVIGGGRKLLQARRSRALAARLQAPDLRPEEIAESVEYGRDLLPDLLALLDPQTPPEVRQAAGSALVGLWARDQLIAEEEKGITTRGFTVDWSARRRYPRAIDVPIPVGVRFGIPFLGQRAPTVQPTNLEWSTRVTGAGRVALERWSAWNAGAGAVTWSLIPADFPTNGPHRLSFEARVRPVGLTSRWELELPRIPFQFEFDPILELSAILAPLDESRAAGISEAIRIEPGLGSPESTSAPDGPAFVLNAELALMEPPALVLRGLSIDLAHRIAIEFEGIPGRFEAAPLVVPQGGAEPKLIPIELQATVPADQLDRTGEIRIRAHLEAQPALGWSHPEIRSVWPGPITTAWQTVRLVRR